MGHARPNQEDGGDATSERQVLLLRDPEVLSRAARERGRFHTRGERARERQ